MNSPLSLYFKACLSKISEDFQDFILPIFFRKVGTQAALSYNILKKIPPTTRN